MAEKFVLVRQVRISEADLRLFEFDYDLTWFGFLISADEKVYGRYGGRDAKSDDGRLSLAGLRYAMDRALDRHHAGEGIARPAGPPNRVIDTIATRKVRRGDCIHCHQVAEFQRADAKAAGTWTRDAVWSYPLPENVGLTLSVDRGDTLEAVSPKGPAAAAGLRAGDRLRRLNGLPVASFADAQFALHKAPKSGSIPVEWSRDGRATSGKLEVKEGWRKTNVTWRPSLLEILPSLPISGDELSADERKALAIPDGHAAFRQDKFVHSTLKAVGLQPGDVIVGLNGNGIPGTMSDFLGHIRREYLVGDTIVLNVRRGGKAAEVKVKLK